MISYGLTLLIARILWDKAAESFENDVREEMFPLFSEFATCAEVADVYHSWTFYNSEAKDFMPDFTSRD